MRAVDLETSGCSPWSVNYDVLLAEESCFCSKGWLHGTATPSNAFAVCFCQIKM